MKRVLNYFRRLKLNQKLSIAVFALAFIPFVSLAAVLILNMQNVVINERLNEMQGNLLQVRTRSEKMIDLCSMTTQFFLNSPKLHDFLLRASLGDPFSADELINFSRDDVSGYEKLVNANPYLYQVRVYQSNPDIPEIMPILYHASRMERLQWAGKVWSSGSWQLDYDDPIFPKEVLQPARHIMSLVTEINDYRYGRIGVLEVAIRMSELFPDLFTDQSGYFCGFTARDPDASGTDALAGTGAKWFYHENQEAFWRNYGETILSLLEGKNPPAGASIEAILGGRSAIISAIPAGHPGGQYITVMFRDDITAALDGRRNLFLLGTVLSLLLLAFIVNLLVKAMLRRFYRIVGAISAVRSGNLDVKAPVIGDDEIGLLGEQINLMLDRIRKLMDENVKRELLAKNSEIRALHSQINAHFIYNVLESIKMMAEVDSRYEISDALTSLGKQLRYSMRWTSENVTVADEIENLENYIHLINLRFDYRVSLNKDFPPHLLAQGIPKLTLQPLVENAVVHGIEELAEDAVIDIKAQEFDVYFTIQISDRGKGIPQAALNAINSRLAGNIGEDRDSAGIGLKNVQDRIIIAFGPEYGVSLTSEPGLLTCVTIRIPYTKQNK
jgi:two-component system sensor histidine kinase YesM